LIPYSSPPPHPRPPASSSLCLTDPPPSQPSPLSLPEALPISDGWAARCLRRGSQHRPPRIPHGREADRHRPEEPRPGLRVDGDRDRKSTRLNSSHVSISYAVFC